MSNLFNQPRWNNLRLVGPGAKIIHHFFSLKINSYKLVNTMIRRMVSIQKVNSTK